MESIEKECTALKHQYDECFNSWFSEHFLNGKHQDKCRPLFTVYQQCVKQAIRRREIDVSEIEKRVLDTEKESKFSNSQSNK